MKFNVNATEEQIEAKLVSLLPEKYSLKIIKRQLRITGGVVDILAKSTIEDGLYIVIEVKVGDITPDSVCQVLRYTQQLNSEHSKSGKRRFIPLVIGNGISKSESNGHLYKLLKMFNDAEDEGVFYCQYTLFNIGIDGLGLNWYDKENKEFIDNTYVNLYSERDSIINKNSEISYDLFLKERECESSLRLLEFIKNNASVDWENLLREYKGASCK